MQAEYDPPTAITFLLAGLGLGALLALMLAPRDNYRPEFVPAGPDRLSERRPVGAV
jgi:hypothetical protein